QRRTAAFERGDALLERADRRVGDARVDVAEGLQVEQARCMVDAVEHERCRLIDRQCARACRGIRNLPRVQAERVETELAVRHETGRLMQNPSWPRSGSAGWDAEFAN